MFKGEKKLLFYETQGGTIPFRSWLECLGDRKARHIVQTRLDRLRYGIAGKYRSVGLGVFELRIFFGPGYRIYFGEYGESIILLLCGGDKSTQVRDIQKAWQYWKDYKERK